jgi:hypothetical protein
MSTRRKAANSSRNSKKKPKQKTVPPVPEKAQADLPAIPEMPPVVEAPRIFTSEKAAMAEWLKPWQFKPGQSGNPAGRPRKQPMTQALEYAADLPCPPAQKKNLERILGVQLSNSLTLIEAVAIGQLIKAVTNTQTAQWVGDHLDGPLVNRLQLESPGGAPLLIPNLTLQFVELNAEGKAVRVIDLEAPPPIGSDPPPPPEPMPDSSNSKIGVEVSAESGSSDAATKLPSPDTK